MKGKVNFVFLIKYQYYIRKARKYLFIPKVFINFVASYYPIAGNEMLALIGGLAYHIRKTFNYVFFWSIGT